MESKRIYLAPPYQSGTELQELQSVLSSNWLAPHGKKSHQFVEKLKQLSASQHLLLTNSGTSALHLAFQVLGIEKGDEVICPTYTFAASIFPILYQQAKPILVDVDPNTWNINPTLVEQCIQAKLKKGKKPKAILVVHNYGNPADWSQLEKISQTYDIPLIEDAAEAVGSSYANQAVGSLGDVSVYSFNANKIITTSGGGCMICKDEKYYQKAFLLSNQAKESKDYYHHNAVGYNYTMSDVQAALGMAQLSDLKYRVEKKRKIFDQYVEELNGLSFQQETINATSNRWLSVVKVENPLAVKQALEESNIETRLSWKPMHQQPVFKDCESYLNGTSDQLFDSVLCLPSGVGLTEEEQSLVIEKLKKLI